MFRKYMPFIAWSVCLLVTLCSARAESYRDGKYLGLAREGPFMVKLEVIIDGGRIKDIQYLQIPDWETQGIKSVMRQRILKEQSPRVDSITGATVSCELIKSAVGEALGQAEISPTPSPGRSSTPTRPDIPRVILKTEKGEIEIRLYPDQAPRAVENFLTLVRRGYYDGTIFHRVIENFMIQGGDPTGTGKGGASAWGKPFPDEFSEDLKFDKVGLLAMANHGPDTNGSQFFITVVKTPWLNRLHTIFGEVVSGFEVVEYISRVPTQGRSHRPREEQKIIKARIK